MALEETPLYSVPSETNHDLVEKDHIVTLLPPEERVSYVLFSQYKILHNRWNQILTYNNANGTATFFLSILFEIFSK